MKRAPHDEGLRWYEQAEADFKGAQVLYDNRVYHLACFICQQVAEKALKGFLYSRGEEIVTGYSVERLATWCAEFSDKFRDLREEIAPLDAYYIPTRYPNGLPDGIPARVFTEKVARDALRLAGLTLQVVGQEIGRVSQPSQEGN